MKKIGILLLIVLLVVSLTACKSNDYQQAMELYINKDYDTALTMFEKLGDYEDSVNMAQKCKYAQALALMEKGRYDEALALFEELGDYEDSASYVSGMGWYLFLNYVAGQGELAPTDLLYNHTGVIYAENDTLCVEIANDIFSAKAVIGPDKTAALLRATYDLRIGAYEIKDKTSTKWNITRYKKGDCISWDEYDHYFSYKNAFGKYSSDDNPDSLSGESGANLIIALTDCLQKGLGMSGLDVTMADLGFAAYGK